MWLVNITSALIIVAVSSQASSQSNPARVTRSTESFEERYLKQKQSEFAASERATIARGRAPQSVAIYNLLREKGPMNSADVVGRTPQEKEQVRDALVRTVAYYLTAIGLTPDQIRRLERDNLDPLQAGADILLGRWSIEDAFVVSPIVIVAEVSANAAAANPVDRQLTLAPTRTFKGSISGPITLRVRLPSTLAQASVGTRYLVFLSSELGLFQQAAGRKSDGNTAFVAMPFEWEGDRYRPLDPAQEDRTRTLGEIDQFAATHASSFSEQ